MLKQEDLLLFHTNFCGTTMMARQTWSQLIHLSLIIPYLVLFPVISISSKLELVMYTVTVQLQMYFQLPQVMFRTPWTRFKLSTCWLK